MLVRNEGRGNEPLSERKQIKKAGDQGTGWPTIFVERGEWE